MKRVGVALSAVAMLAGGMAGAQKLARSGPPVSVPTSPLASEQAHAFRDRKYGVQFDVPAGWTFNTKDGQVSTFHADALTAARKAEMRGVASLDFNPFPMSVLSGATFYFSVAKHVSAAACSAQAAAPADVQDIGGMEFRHAHAEHGRICVEARDDVYTAYRKGSCYRFDLEVNTFCSVSSGAQDLTVRQMIEVERQMTDILSSVTLAWEKSGAHTVPVPDVAPKKPAEPELVPRERGHEQVGQ